MPHKEEKEGIFPSPAIAMSLGIAFLYLLGDAFRSGFLASIGIDKTIFNDTFEATLLHGFNALAFIFIHELPGLIGFFIGLAGFIILGAFLQSRRESPRWGRISRALFYGSPKDAETAREKSPTTHATVDLLFLVVIFAAPIIVFAGMWTGAWWAGKRLADDVRARMDLGTAYSGLVGTWEGATVSIQTNGSSVDKLSGFILGTGRDFMAIYHNKHIVLVPTQKVVRIDVEENPAAAPSSDTPPK